MYIFQPQRELLDLNAMEMDGSLVRFFKEQWGLEDLNITLNAINDDGLTRKIQVNLQEKLLQGRGIKGFFALYDGVDFLFIQKLDAENVKISKFDKLQTNWKSEIAEAPAVIQRMDEVLKSMGQLRQQDQCWFDLYERAQLLTSRSFDLICVPHLREIEPFEYQLKTVKSVIERFKGRALLCDEVGLGKTVEAGICLQEYIMRGLARKILILVPPSLMNQWQEELRRKFNQAFIRSDDSSFIAKGEQAWGHFPKVIASISTAKRPNHQRLIAEQYYDLVIVDEAHHLKNRNTVAWKFVNSLKKKYMLLLTATPVQNSLEELFNLITLLRPGQLQTYRQFRKNFVEDNKGIEVKNADKLKLLLSEVMLRNRRSHVEIKFTPRKAMTKVVKMSLREQQLYVDISQMIREHYLNNHPVFSRFQLKNLQEQMGSSFSALLGSLQKLAKNEALESDLQVRIGGYYERAAEIASEEIERNEKLEALEQIISSFDDKMLVFTKYKATQEMISRTLRNRGFKVAEFHGGLRRVDKEREIAFFREEAQVLVSTEVGGEGRNLQFCNGLVNFDLPWNPMAIEQRIGRIHRIGQTRDVFVYNLASQNTVEHYMLNVLDRKINLFELVVGEVDMILGDIEESNDFADLVMNAWVDAADETMMEQKMDELGEKMLENKNRLEKVKALDERLFA